MRIVFALALALVLGCSNSSPATDAASGAAFACGSATCATTTQYCYRVEAGRVPAVPVVGCNAVPSGCGATPTCACVLAGDTFSCGLTPSCSAEGSAVTVTCANP
jgi:hypothetical protein